MHESLLFSRSLQNFNELLRSAGIDPEDVRLMRHSPANYGLWLERRHDFDRYQENHKDQQHKVLSGSQHWASFVVTPGGETMFVGLYDARYLGLNETLITSDRTGQVYAPQTRHVYQSSKNPLLAPYEARLFIDWGPSKISWCQYASRNDKLILNIALDPNQERGGNEAPRLRSMPGHAPESTDEPSAIFDPEARRVALERRVKQHHALVEAFRKRVEGAGRKCVCSQYADALCDGSIFEMKTISNDEIAQVRAAIGQLYHYLFLHREIAGYEQARLYAVFDRKIDEKLLTFVVNTAHIGVIWLSNGAFDADASTKKALPWLI